MTYKDAEHQMSEMHQAALACGSYSEQMGGGFLTVTKEQDAFKVGFKYKINGITFTRQQFCQALTLRQLEVR